MYLKNIIWNILSYGFYRKVNGALYTMQWFCPIGGGGEVVSVTSTGMADRRHNVEIICAQSSYVLSYKKGENGEMQLDLSLISSVRVIHANNLGSAIAGSILAKISNKHYNRSENFKPAISKLLSRSPEFRDQ